MTKNTKIKLTSNEFYKLDKAIERLLFTTRYKLPNKVDRIKKYTSRNKKKTASFIQ